ncbi:hypothetical protein Ciccas_003475 [Cichlidogyrus casuarinus]|uniref:Uncharacterized protein n=1 Tax=Cichlidogyrus casuarinus TaxID=1844966 RepID=A0ABD2QER2_9PLAT
MESLLPDERTSIEALVPQKSKILCAGVVKAYEWKDRWIQIGCGMACFEKDSSKRSYFIRVYDVDLGKNIIDKEFTRDAQYQKLLPNFHAFSTSSIQIYGLSFANAGDSGNFACFIHQRQVSAEKAPKSTVPMPPAHYVPPSPAPAPMVASSIKSIIELAKNSLFTLRNEKVKELSKNDISLPSNFERVQHIGRDNASDLESMIAQTKQSNMIKDRWEEDFVRSYMKENKGVYKMNVDRSMTVSGPVCDVPMPPAHYVPPSPAPAPMVVSSIKSIIELAKNSLFTLRNEEVKELSKNDISPPSNFERVQHIGRDNASDLESMIAQMKQSSMILDGWEEDFYKMNVDRSMTLSGPVGDVQKLSAPQNGQSIRTAPSQSATAPTVPLSKPMHPRPPPRPGSTLPPPNIPPPRIPQIASRSPVPPPPPPACAPPPPPPPGSIPPPRSSPVSTGGGHTPPPPPASSDSGAPTNLLSAIQSFSKSNLKKVSFCTASTD